MSHGEQIGLVFTEAVNHLTEQKEEKRHGRSMNNGTDGAEDHEDVIVVVSE